MLKTLTLKGVAAKKFGRVHRFHVADIREMLRAMCSQVPGFKNTCPMRITAACASPFPGW
jgi:predicted phage tail protein